MIYFSIYSKETPDSSTPVPASQSPAPPLPADFTSLLTSDLYPLQSGDQLPLGLLDEESLSKIILSFYVIIHSDCSHVQLTNEIARIAGGLFAIDPSLQVVYGK